MIILVSNDDGIQAEGLHRLAKALGEKGQVYVFAPDKQRSASSHALSIHNIIEVSQVEFPEAEMAFQLSGTPADCVKLGIDILKRRGLVPDIIYAGINHGGNLGTDTMYSGTVSAAAEGVFAGYPAVAVSVCDHFPQYFEGACDLAVSVFEAALATAGRNSVISINTPNKPKEEILGVKAARLGTMEYDEWFEEVEPEKIAEYDRRVNRQGKEQTAILYKYSGSPAMTADQEEDIDVRLISEGYATISMVKYDLNDYEGLKELKRWEIGL